MISYSVYKIVHLLGIFLIFMSVAALCLHVIQGGSKKFAWRKPVMITHGVGMFLALLGGFGLLARLGIVRGLPAWAYAKIGIWLIFGAMIAVIMRKPKWSRYLWWCFPVLGVIAAWLAIYKPF